MDPMKRVRLAVLFLLVAALLGSTPLLAAPKENWPPKAPADFVLLPVGDEPGASGEAWVYYEGEPHSLLFPRLSVKCNGLTPRATYRVDVRVYYFLPTSEGYWTLFETTANNKGAFKGDGWFYDPHLGGPWASADSVLVYRVEPTEDVLVLSATRYDPWPW